MAENGDEEFKKFLDDGDGDGKCPCPLSKEDMILKTIETKTGCIVEMTQTLLNACTSEFADESVQRHILEKAESLIDLFTESIKTYDYLLTRLIDDEE